ncbi:MAG: hypothetical protein ACTS73_09785 [Arsenophonus sp. NEOnobi-MAG3]
MILLLIKPLIFCWQGFQQTILQRNEEAEETSRKTAGILEFPIRALLA